MYIKKPGKVTNRITMLGRFESCVYLVEGDDESVILGGGMTFIIPDILKQIREFNINEERIKKIIIHHNHFDHIGIVPYFLKRWPWLEVLISPRGKELLDKKKVTDSLSGLNRIVLSKAGLEEMGDEFSVGNFDKIKVKGTISDGDVISIGNINLNIIETPGHSSCSISVYIPEEKALSASDGGGVPFKNNIFTTANSNFDLYQQSLEKLAVYRPRVYMSEHYGAITGINAETFIQRSIKSAKDTRLFMEETYKKTMDEGETVKILTDHFITEHTDSFLPREVLTMVLGQMIRFIAKKHSKN